MKTFSTLVLSAVAAMTVLVTALSGTDAAAIKRATVNRIEYNIVEQGPYTFVNSPVTGRCYQFSAPIYSVDNQSGRTFEAYTDIQCQIPTSKGSKVNAGSARRYTQNAPSSFKVVA